MNMPYDIEKIAGIVAGRLVKGRSGFHSIQHILIDSRKVLFPHSSCFFALSGQRRDGHTFIHDLYNKGVSHFVVNENFDGSAYPEAHFVGVEDVLVALQKLAAFHRKQFTYPVVAITGSNGKTIVKEWLFTGLQDDIQIVKSPGSYNSQIGVPLSVWQMEENCELGIFEVGISRKGEMAALANITCPNIGIFVSLGSAHDAGFADRREKMEEKLLLFDRAEDIIFCADETLVNEGIQSRYGDRNLLSWGSAPDNFLQVKDSIKWSNDHTEVQCICAGESFSIYLPFEQEIDLHNAMHVVVFLIHRGYTTADINRKMSLLHHLNMRLELKKGNHNTLLVNDTYTNDPESLQAALSFLNQQASQREKMLILSGFQEQQNSALEDWRAFFTRLVDTNQIKILVGIGSEMSWILEARFDKCAVHLFKDTAALIENISDLPLDDKAILLKASRKYELEKAVAVLSAKSHRAILEVNLEAIRNNVSVYGVLLKPGTKIMVMLKAQAYGSGDEELARYLEEIKVDYFAVAYIDEGVALRQAGIQLPILVLNPDPIYFHMIRKYRLDPEIYSMDQLERFVSISGAEEMLGIHIKIDTGMHRLGFEEDDLAELVTFLHKNPWIRVESTFTHMACSEDRDCDEFTHEQMEKFERMYGYLAGKLGYRPLRHAMNSAGILRFPSYHMEMVRLGMGLYGTGRNAAHMVPAHTLKARISQIKTIKKGDSVGYGRKWIAQRSSVIATINIGYADGLMRKAGNENYAIKVHGQSAYIVGNICMDMCMVDVTEIEDVHLESEVIVFGPDHPIERLAEVCGTSSYEILSRLSSRINRVYLQDG